ncbi:MAG: hypothetical protein IJH37_07790 [Clostridia bacterium]|nr:hypothetical protein [Clostridia bacterium]
MKKENNIKVTVANEVDIDSIPTEDILPLMLFIAEETKAFFGKPESMAKLEEWRNYKKDHNLDSK